MKLFKQPFSTGGFSVLELLVVVILLGIGAKLAIAIFSDASQGADDAKNRRNAQEIAIVASSASAAGIKFLVPGDEVATINNLVLGKKASGGIFKDRIYKLPPMHESEIQGALKYLTASESGLVYSHETSP